MVTKQPEKKTYNVVRFEFDDGTTKEIRPDRPSTLVAFEKEEGRGPNESVVDVFRLCYIADGHPNGQGDEAFEAWVDTIDTFENATLDRPTRAPRTS